MDSKSPSQDYLDESKFEPHNHYFRNGEFYFPTGFGRSFIINMKDSNGEILRPNVNINDFIFKFDNKVPCKLSFSSKNELAAILYNVYENNDEKYESIEFEVNKLIFVMNHTCSSHTGPNDEFKPYNKKIDMPFREGCNMINHLKIITQFFKNSLHALKLITEEINKI